MNLVQMVHIATQNHILCLLIINRKTAKNVATKCEKICELWSIYKPEQL